MIACSAEESGTTERQVSPGVPGPRASHDSSQDTEIGVPINQCRVYLTKWTWARRVVTSTSGKQETPTEIGSTDTRHRGVAGRYQLLPWTMNRICIFYLKLRACLGVYGYSTLLLDQEKSGHDCIESYRSPTIAVWYILLILTISKPSPISHSIKETDASAAGKCFVTSRCYKLVATFWLQIYQLVANWKVLKLSKSGRWRCSYP